MSNLIDPYAHHPNLRGKIRDPETSFFRNFKPSDLDERMAALGAPKHWRLTDEAREAARHEVLAQIEEDDVWIFAYGSLMWDPAFKFADVRRADISGYARKFCLKDEIGGRGTRSAPGLVAALDTGDHCAGLAFRIARDVADRETAIIWRREMITGAYSATVVEAKLSDRTVPAIAFVANHQSKNIYPDIERSDQIRFLATGKGVLGTSREYLENLASHLEMMRIEDEDLFSLLADVQQYAVENHREPDATEMR